MGRFGYLLANEALRLKLDCEFIDMRDLIGTLFMPVRLFCTYKEAANQLGECYISCIYRATRDVIIMRQ